MALNTRVLIVGAGGSVADCVHWSLRKKPPLDKGFFRAARKTAAVRGDLQRIQDYLRVNYAISSVAAPEHDSLEGVMGRLFSDSFHPKLGVTAYDAFLGLIKVFNRRLAESTNRIPMTNRRLLYRVIRRQLKECGHSSRLTIITFNQDIQIEKALEQLTTHSPAKMGSIFSFPHLYGLGSPSVTSVSGEDLFRVSEPDDDAVKLLKLHGSLNWYSTHTSGKPSQTALFNQSRKLAVTRRKKIDPDMKLGKGRGKLVRCIRSRS
jgi:hypothetical protein